MNYYSDIASFDELKGKTIIKIQQLDHYNGDELQLTTDDGYMYKMYHTQDCCESVYLEDVTGDFNDLLGSPILVAEEIVHSATDDDKSDLPTQKEMARATFENDAEAAAAILKGWSWEPEFSESATWTFYKLDTAQGGVTIRWFGTSNGYYSESVYLYKEKIDD